MRECNYLYDTTPHANICTYPPIYKHPHTTRTRTHTHTHTHTYTHTHTHTHTHTQHVHKHTHIHMYSRMILSRPPQLADWCIHFPKKVGNR